MERELLIQYINKKLSTRQIGELVGKSQTNVRYWLSKYNLKTDPSWGFGVSSGRVRSDVQRYCTLCGNKTVKGYLCAGCRTKIRRHRTKLAAIKYLGGECHRCGYKEHIAAFEFHHIDGSKKEFSIGSCANKSWKILKPELDKCELLCSNCHRIEHSNREDTKFLEAVYNYQGRLLDF